MPRQAKGTFDCPHCGAEVPFDSIACPHCGSDDETGWSRDTEYDDLDLPTGYGREDRPPRNTKSKEAFWRAVAIVVLAIMILLVLLRAL